MAPTPEKITSLQNPRVKQLVKLRDRRPRDEAGLFLIEGYREVKRALEAGVKLAELYCGPDWFLGENEPALIDAAREAGAQVFELSKQVFAKVSYRDRPDGLLAVAPQWRRELADLQLKAPPFLLVVEAIEKPGNLGTILRSADAAGVDAVLVCDPVTDLFNPNVVRSSTGVLFSVPVVMAESAEVRAWLRDQGIRAVATTPAAPALYTESDLRGPLAIVMGSEQYGSERVLAEGKRPAGAHSHGRPGRLAQRGHGRDHHAVRSGAAAGAQTLNFRLATSSARPSAGETRGA